MIWIVPIGLIIGFLIFGFGAAKLVIDFIVDNFLIILAAAATAILIIYLWIVALCAYPKATLAVTIIGVLFLLFIL